MKFLIPLATFVGLALTLPLSGNVKQDLLKRLETAEHQLEKASADYTRKGFDYFAEQVQDFNSKVLVIQAAVEKLPESATEQDAAKQTADVAEIEKQVPDTIQYPAGREIYKAGGLYFAVVKTDNHNTADPKPEVLKKQVADIIAQENNLKTLPKDQHEKAEANLKASYDALVKTFRHQNTGIPSPDDLNKLEAEAKKKIEAFHKEGKHEQANAIQSALNRGIESTFQIGKIFPIDSLTRFNQFLAAAPAHYQDYKIVKALVSGTI